MKILSLHCDYIKFKPLKKALREPEKLAKKDEKEKKIEEVLVIFTAVEKQDEGNKNIVKEYVDNVEDLAKQVSCKTIVLYPYAHLSSSLSSPSFAEKTMKNAEKKLKGLKVVRAPFGYYKEFELKCKGHPLAELSREIGAGERKVEKGKKVITEKYDYKKLLREISKSKLDTRKLKENDHRILGQKMDLFSFSDVAPGMVFWHNNGLLIKNLLIEFWREEHKKAGYQEVSTPQILDKKLWQISGHWEKYTDDIFLTEYENREFVVKPMNCPGVMLMYKSKPKSYKDLPLRIGELGIVHRQELSGVLGGLFRVVQFTQDDAHIFCSESELEQEIINIIELTQGFYKLFGFEYHIELSTRPKKKIGSEKQWDKAEKALEGVLRKKKIKFKFNKGDGAFYGPKIDFHIKDSLNRTWQLATIQLDFAMPERFGLSYKEKNDKLVRPVMIHRTIYGSLERFIGILLEHTKGNLPYWLFPIQCRVLPLSEKYIKEAELLAQDLNNKQKIRTDLDNRDLPLSKKVSDAEKERVPYILTIGEKELKNQILSVRIRETGKVKEIKPHVFRNILRKKQAGMPWKPLPLPILLSKRARFV